MATVPVNTVWGFGDWGNAEYGAQKGLIMVTEEGTYTAESTSDYLLPSFNLSIGLNDNEVIRFGVSDTIAQPSLWQTRALVCHNDGCAIVSLTPNLITSLSFKPILKLKDGSK